MTNPDSTNKIQAVAPLKEAKTRKQSIYEAAVQLFRDKGYPASTMRDLADRVGLKQASSLYNHVKSKEEILQNICFATAQKFVDGMKAIEVAEDSITEKIQQLIRLHVRIATEDLTSVTVFNDEWRYLSEPHLTSFLKLRRDYEERFKSLIELGIQQGLFKDMEATIVLYSMLSSVRWLHHWYRPDREVYPDGLAQTIATLLLEGLNKND
ncbi:MAG: TetR/AcrR family transcriptional regulator [Bacteroidota bacterium]